MKQAKRKFYWSLPERFPGVDAQRAGEFIEALPDRQPETILEASKSARSPLHSIFEWSDSKAAHSHRLHQVRAMLGNLVVDVVIYVRNKRQDVRVKAIHKVDRAGRREFTTDAMVDETKRNYILAQALSELNAIRRRYKILEELADVFAAIDKVAA